MGIRRKDLSKQPTAILDRKGGLNFLEPYQRWLLVIISDFMEV